ncbi:retrovirus-related pol polyprotein from transposon TNT 1-94 [Tanacetum coccineum]
MWKRVERLMRGTIQNQVDRETRFTNEFDPFITEPGEALVSVYNRFAQLMNGLERNKMIFPIVTVNTKFLNSLQPEWVEIFTKFGLLTLTSGIRFDGISLLPSAIPEKLVYQSRAKEVKKDDVQTNFEDLLASAMLLLARAITKKISNLTNNRLRTSSNTRNQAIIQGDRVNIQNRNSGNTSTIQCYNCSGEGHYARNCPKPRVRDSKYFMEQMLMAKQDEAGADQKAKRFDQQAQSQFVRDRDIIRDLEKQRDKLDLAVIEYKRKNEELQKTHSKLKRQMSENEDSYHDTVLDLEAKLKKNVDIMMKLGNSLQGMFMLGPKPLSVYNPRLKHGLGYPNPYTLKQAISQCLKLYRASSLGNPEVPLDVRDTEDILDDASKSQNKMKEKMNDPIAVGKKQNCWSINYKQINALYDDFVPQKELSAEQKYLSSSFISTDKTSNATPSISASMPSDSYLIKYLEKMKKCFETLFEDTENKNCSLDFTVQSLMKERDNVKIEYQKLFDSIKKTRSQSQKEMDELIAHVFEKTYAYGAIRAENQNLLSIISELKTRLETVEKGKSINTKFDMTNISQNLLCVTPTSPDKQRGANSNKNVIAPGMYRVVTTQESQTNKAKSDLSSTRMNDASSVIRPMNKDSHVKNSVLAKSKNSAKKVAVHVRKK